MILLRPGNGRPLAHNRLVGGSSPPEPSRLPANSPELAGFREQVSSPERHALSSEAFSGRLSLPRKIAFPDSGDRWHLRNLPTASGQCDLRTVFPKVISGLRRPIAIQAAISLNMNLPEWPS